VEREREIERTHSISNRSMAELRHSSSLGSRATNSPMKRDAIAVAVGGAGDSSPLITESHLTDDDEHDRHSSKERDRHVCSFLNDDPRVSPHHSRISLFFTFLLILVGLVSVFTIFHKLVSPLCPRFRFTNNALHPFSPLVCGKRNCSSVISTVILFI